MMPNVRVNSISLSEILISLFKKNRVDEDDSILYLQIARRVANFNSPSQELQVSPA